MCLYKNIILVSITILCTFQKTVAYIHTICIHCCEICVYVCVCVKILNKSSVNFVLLRHSEVKSFSRVRLFVTPWTGAYQASPSMRFSRQEYWISFSRGSSRPRDLTRVSCIGGRHFNLWATREALKNMQLVSLTHCEIWHDCIASSGK